MNPSESVPASPCSLPSSCQASWRGVINTSCPLITEHSIMPELSVANRSFSTPHRTTLPAQHTLNEPGQRRPLFCTWPWGFGRVLHLRPHLGGGLRKGSDIDTRNSPGSELVFSDFHKKLLAACSSSTAPFILIKSTLIIADDF